MNMQGELFARTEYDRAVDGCVKLLGVDHDIAGISYATQDVGGKVLKAAILSDMVELEEAEAAGCRFAGQMDSEGPLPLTGCLYIAAK